MPKKDTSAIKNSSDTYPPVVTVLGHVDHGKTTLLDAIRKTDIAGGEHGGITQKIGASTIEVVHEKAKRRITFIDTPGHETFAKMRSRGANVADIGLLVVSVVNGVAPQTKESIQTLKTANIPYIVVLTKADVEGKNPEKVKQQLLKEGVALEGLGGDVPYIAVSAKTGFNIGELLDLMLLVFDMHKKSEDPSNKSMLGIVIESRQDPKAGPKATIVVKRGIISSRDKLVCEGILARVKALFDTFGKQVPRATVGEAVEVLGFEKIPPVGAVVMFEKDSVKTVEETSSPLLKKDLSFTVKPQDTISIILVADSYGSLEAIASALGEKIIVNLKKAGEITAADILHAKSTGSLIIGFNAGVKPEIARLAKVEKVLLKNYTIIYELLAELAEVLAGKALSLEEQILGRAKVLASFPYEKTKVLGVKILEGRIAKGDKVRLMHGENAIGDSIITSVRQGKNQISKAEQNQEAGIIISPSLDFEIGDMVLSVD